jgi:uncharacterized protein YgfB (UPF0149 family)
MKNLCRALIWNACFLELSDDDVIDPDSALKALEDMAAALQQATEEEKQAFVAACAEEAADLANTANYARTAEFVRGLPAAFGL